MEKRKIGQEVILIYDPATGGTKKVGGIAEGEKFGGRWAFHYLGTYQTEEEAAKALMILMRKVERNMQEMPYLKT